MAEHPEQSEQPGRIIVDDKGTRVEHGPPSAAQQADIAARIDEHAAEQTEKAKLRGDHAAAVLVLREAAKTDPVAAAIATLLGLNLPASFPDF